MQEMRYLLFWMEYAFSEGVHSYLGGLLQETGLLLNKYVAAAVLAGEGLPEKILQMWTIP